MSFYPITQGTGLVGNLRESPGGGFGEFMLEAVPVSAYVAVYYHIA